MPIKIFFGLTVFFSIACTNTLAIGSEISLATKTDEVAYSKVLPFQPPSSEMNFVGKIYDTGSRDFTFSMYGNSQQTILVEGIPFARYWQLKDPNKFVFHPMVWGRYIFEQSSRPTFISAFQGMIDKTAQNLPNDGLAFYYPNHYPLNRMRGPDLMYSAISQSEILAGFVKLELTSPSDRAQNLSNRVLKALLFPYEQGGVNLHDLAFLELPLFRSNPEIILNGWLHALLHLNDWSIARGDKIIQALIERNLKFFVKNKNSWYDSERNITLYSDTSPLRVLATGQNSKQNYKIAYISKTSDLPNYQFDPVEDFSNKYGAYDTRIIARKERRTTIDTTCSKLFQTVISSDQPFSIHLKPHQYDPKRATPKAAGSSIALAAKRVSRSKFEVRIDPSSNYLLCGFPTNFSKKNGKNFYHVQHIVALRYLAEFGNFENDDLKSKIRNISEDWFKKTREFKFRNVKDFERLQVVLDSINRGKVYTQAKKIEDLGLSEF